MTTKRVRSTAFSVATIKALEYQTPAAWRLYDDPYTARMLTGPSAWAARHRWLMGLLLSLGQRHMPGVFGGMSCRTRAIDDVCRISVSQGIRQVVILGAGLDVRAQRLPEFADCHIWEVDAPEVQAFKKQRVQHVFGSLPAHVTYVPTDFMRQNLADALRDAQFDAQAAALFICEGVSQYINAEANDAIFRFVGQCAPGSCLVLSYVLQRVFGDRLYGRFVKRLQWVSGFETVTLATRLMAHGLRLDDDLGAAQYQERYLAPLGRALPVFDIERVAVARKPI